MSIPKRNPVYPRWVDPFFGKTKEDLLEIGQGNLQRGYDKILDDFIRSWNADAKVNKFIPPTSRREGMKWPPDIKKINAEWRRLRSLEGTGT